MKPFNLKDALAGKKVITRAGLEVVQIAYLDKVVDLKRPVFAAIKGSNGKIYTATFSENGVYSILQEGDPNDLFMASEKREYWVNLWRSKDGVLYTGHITYTSYAKAREMVTKVRMNFSGSRHLGTVKIYEEEI